MKKTQVIHDTLMWALMVAIFVTGNSFLAFAFTWWAGAMAIIMAVFSVILLLGYSFAKKDSTIYSDFDIEKLEETLHIGKYSFYSTIAECLAMLVISNMHESIMLKIWSLLILIGLYTVISVSPKFINLVKEQRSCSH